MLKLLDFVFRMKQNTVSINSGIDGGGTNGKVSCYS